MALTDIKALGAAKKYTDETAISFGAVRGAPCTIKSITKGEGKNTVTFGWKNEDGEERSAQMVVKDGQGGGDIAPLDDEDIAAAFERVFGG